MLYYNLFLHYHIELLPLGQEMQSVPESPLGFIDYIFYIIIYSNIIIHSTTGITKNKKCHHVYDCYSPINHECHEKIIRYNTYQTHTDNYM